VERPWNLASFRRNSLMVDLGAIGIVLACFAILFAILYALDRI
jgi:hypothetical protein